MYERLLSERKIAKEDMLESEHISAITFKRYLYDIKDYLALNQSPFKLIYARRYKIYKLVPKTPDTPLNETTQFVVGACKLAYR